MTDLQTYGFGGWEIPGQTTFVLRLGFLAGLAVAVAGTSTAAVGLYRCRAWAVPLLASVWPGFALVCLTLDRITPALNPERSLTIHLVTIGLIPGVVTLLLGRRRDARPTRPADVATGSCG